LRKESKRSNDLPICCKWGNCWYQMISDDGLVFYCTRETRDDQTIDELTFPSGKRRLVVSCPLFKNSKGERV